VFDDSTRSGQLGAIDTPLTFGTLYTLGPLLATYFELLKGIKERDLANRISSDGNDDRGG
jgi:hypothetical protein